jgi:hypothetical protein
MAGIADLLTGALDVLDMPGSYARGALAGKLGQRLSGSQLAKEYGFDSGDGVGRFATDLGVGMLTDPLTYVLPGASALATKGAQKFGAADKAAAAARGPQYGTSVDDLLKVLPKYFDEGKVVDFHDIIKANPRIAKEVPPGSELLGKGAESVALLHRPTGQVTKIMTPMLKGTDDIMPRPDIADMVQASRSKYIPNAAAKSAEDFAGVRIEHEPLMRINTGEIPPDAFRGMAKHLQSQGVDPWDIVKGRVDEPIGYNPGNLGISPQGRVMVTDPGAVLPMDKALPLAGEVPRKDPGALMSALLKFTGADRRMRKQLAEAARVAKGGKHGTPFDMTLGELREMAGMSTTPKMRV